MEEVLLWIKGVIGTLYIALTCIRAVVSMFDM